MESTVMKGLIDFALKTDKVLSNNENMVFSPFSLSTALAMALMGAQDTCAEELSNVLFGKTIKTEEYHSLAKEYEILVERCVKNNSKVLSSANFMYSDIDFPILPQYQHLIETSFGAKAQELDFRGNKGKAIKTINEDISRATNDKISEILNDFEFNTKFILVNALYFKGVWKSKFRPEMTKISNFTTNEKKIIDVQMMSQLSRFPFTRSDQLKCSALQLSYRKSNTVLIVLLPEEDSSVSELKSKLNGQTLNQLLGEMSIHKLKLFLPKFKISSTLPLIPILSKLGIKQIFDSNFANFSGITSKPDGLYVNSVLQMAVIEVTEEGTVAAAATVMRIGGKSMAIVDSFEVNRPFIFILMTKTDANETTILFTGTVNNPNIK